MISLACPKCAARIKAPAAMAGRTAACPKCKAHLVVASPATNGPIKFQPEPERPAKDTAAEKLVFDSCAASEARERQLDQPDDAPDEATPLLKAVAIQAEQFIQVSGGDAVGYVAKGIALAHLGQHLDAAQSFGEAFLRDAVGLRKPALGRLIDTCERYYASITVLSPEQLGAHAPPGLKELVAALQKLLILADREVPLPGSRADQLIAKARAAAASEAPGKVTCPACREDLKGYVARCPHCTSVLHWMKCPDCQQVVPTKVTQKNVGWARGGYEPVYHCLKCGRKLAGPDCFIATAAYGSPLEPDVALLREFRDQVLVKFRGGRVFVRLYYRNSPALAARIRESPAAKRLTRALLKPVIAVVRIVQAIRPHSRA